MQSRLQGERLTPSKHRQRTKTAPKSLIFVINVVFEMVLALLCVRPQLRPLSRLRNNDCQSHIHTLCACILVSNPCSSLKVALKSGQKALGLPGNCWGFFVRKTESLKINLCHF
jgi:hypothetical protein